MASKFKRVIEIESIKDLSDHLSEQIAERKKAIADLEAKDFKPKKRIQSLKDQLEGIEYVHAIVRDSVIVAPQKDGGA